jgi:chaperonin GroES
MAQAHSDYIELKQVPRPVGDYILIKRGETEDSTTAGGIILPNTSRRLDNSGEIVALGDQSRTTKKGYRVPFEVEVGDYVYFEWHSATRKLKVDEEFYVLLTEQEILFREEKDG